jgi:hypothetical protein
MKYIISAIICILLFGCGDNYQVGDIKEEIVNKQFCTENTIDLRAEFTLTCISNANPHSDEEPEDWIRYCQDMAEQTYCQIQPVKITKKCWTYVFSNCHWREIKSAPLKEGEV